MRKVVIHPAQIPSKGDRPTDEGTSERGGGEGVRLAQEVIRALHMHRARAARAQGRDKTQARETDVVRQSRRTRGAASQCLLSTQCAERAVRADDECTVLR